MSTFSGTKQLVALAALLLGTSPAFGQDDQSLDDLGDILGSTTAPVPTPGEETRDLLRQQDVLEKVEVPAAKKRVIQTLQRKNFMKIDRYEITPQIGLVTNDPFVNRYMGGASFTYHVTEIFGIEASGHFSPNLGRSDWKPITRQIVDNNNVQPDISKIQVLGSVNFQFSPIHGKLAVGRRNIIQFDLFGAFGTGIVQTADDLEALGNDTEVATLTQAQVHPSLNYGGGLRVILSQGLALRLEGRGLSYIEVLESTTLEMKNNMTVLAGISLFLPGMD